MFRYFIYFSYDGAAYHGWQVQPNAITVQQVLEEALAKLVRQPVPLVGAGRTDAGVNAACMVAHGDFPAELDTRQLVYKLNKILPPDIAVSDVRRVKDDAHARFDALSRRYNYRVVTAKSPFARKYACRVMPGIDFDAMNRAASVLYEYTDFTSFSKLHTDVKTNNCKVTYAAWHNVGADEWAFEIEADRFLRNMVRAIVGTLLLVGRGKMTLDGFRAVIENKARGEAGDSAMGEALFLVDVKYPDTIFL
ncbi:MAG: tRNA pseudouridine(38-40) synthase TruA [Bacteroidaceae bacterium]|nr:tRNA pseudouridine(38-40) synthase TruA [Bacteroidaceae bacterium]